MKAVTYFKITTILSLGGVLFSGYLSAAKFLTKSCAFNECPYFLGYPACYFGFGMFLSMFAASLFGLYAKAKSDLLVKFILAVSAAGIIFAGNFVLAEIRLWMSAGSVNYPLVMPTCVYGLIFYIVIFILSLRQVLLAGRSKTA